MTLDDLDKLIRTIRFCGMAMYEVGQNEKETMAPALAAIILTRTYKAVAEHLQKEDPTTIADWEAVDAYAERIFNTMVEHCDDNPIAVLKFLTRGQGVAVVKIDENGEIN